MTDLIRLEALWQFKYEQLEKEIEIFEKDFAKNKKCSCKVLECKHYKKEEKKLFNDRLNKLLTEGVLVNALTTASVLRSPVKH